LIWQGDVHISRNIVYLECVMQQSTAKLFANGDSQAVRLPEEFRFEGTTGIYIRRDAATG